MWGDVVYACGNQRPQLLLSRVPVVIDTALSAAEQGGAAVRLNDSLLW
jgi:hypothetical protein